MIDDIKVVRGKFEVKLNPEVDPAAWMALYHYSEVLDSFDPAASLKIAKKLYEVQLDRSKIQFTNRWNDVLKEITRIRRYQLKDLVENSKFYEDNLHLDRYEEKEEDED